MNLLEKGAQFLNKTRQNKLCIEINYNGEAVSATVGKTVFKLENSFGVIYEESTDFIISVSALLDSPVKGDIIEWGETEYEVLAPDNEPVYRYSDSYKQAYRIHTKRISK